MAVLTRMKLIYLIMAKAMVLCTEQTRKKKTDKKFFSFTVVQQRKHLEQHFANAIWDETIPCIYVRVKLTESGKSFGSCYLPNSSCDSMTPKKNISWNHF